MRKLIALAIGVLAAVGAATIVFFWRKNDGSSTSPWSSAKEALTSWGKTASDEAGRAADEVASAADGATHEASRIVDQAKGAARS
jgi:hypothetical protein